MAFVSPAGIAFHSIEGLEQYAHPGAVVIISLWRLPEPEVRQVAEAGGLVLAYNGFMERPDWELNPEEIPLYGTAPGNWLWGNNRSNWSGTRMTNVRAGSEWGHHYVEDYLPDFFSRHPWVGGIFEDVYGDRLWSDVWGQMSATERDEWTAGMHWWAPRIRAAVGGKILVANNTFHEGNASFDGQVIENHPASNIPFWGSVLAKSWRNGGTHHIYIAKTEAGFDAYLAAAEQGYTKTDGSTALLPLRAIAKQTNVNDGALGYAAVGPVWGPFTDETEPPPPGGTVLPPTSITLNADGTGTVELPADPNRSIVAVNFRNSPHGDEQHPGWGGGAPYGADVATMQDPWALFTTDDGAAKTIGFDVRRAFGAANNPPIEGETKNLRAFVFKTGMTPLPFPPATITGDARIAYFSYGSFVMPADEEPAPPPDCQECEDNLVVCQNDLATVAAERDAAEQKLTDIQAILNS